MGVSIAFLVAAFVAVVSGVSLWSVPAGLVVAGLLLAVAGVALIRLDHVDHSKGEGQ